MSAPSDNMPIPTPAIHSKPLLVRHLPYFIGAAILDVLAANMNFAVHPGYETPTIWTTICDNYIVGPNGAGDCLHKTEKKVFEV